MNNREFIALKNQYEERIRKDLSTGVIKKNKDGKIKKSITLPRDINTGKSKRIQAEGNTIEECAENLAKNYRKIIERKDESLRFRTFGEVAEEWYKIEILNGDISDGNKKNYKTTLYSHILPTLGNLDISQLKSKDFNCFLNKFEGRGESMVKKIRMTLNRIIVYAMENEYMPYRLIKLRLPKTEPIKKRVILPEEQIILLFKAQKKYAPALVFVAMISTGIRPCELYGMKYDDIDFDKKTLNVVKSKTDNGIRTVPLPNFLLKLILEDKKNLEKQGVKPIFVFHQQTEPLKSHTASSLYRTWKTTLREMDILNGAEIYRNRIVKTTINNADELTGYCLRHTFCTELNDCGIGSYYKKRLMGHTLEDSITDGVYTHSSIEKIIEKAQPYINYIEQLYNKAVI